MHTKEELSKLTIPQLKEELKKKDLPCVGKKDELIDRLLENKDKPIKSEATNLKRKGEDENEEVKETSVKKQKTEEPEEKKEETKSPSKPKSTLDSFIVKKATPKKETKEEVEELSDVPLPALSGLLQHLTDESWRRVLQPEFEKPYFKKILEFLDTEKKRGATIFPPEKDIFSAFNLTPFNKIKCVIIGQDPYHDDNQAHGLCFSVRKGIKTPPSLRNIYTELESDIKGFKSPNHGFLEEWAKQGILLLNASLTVEAHKANSHSKCGWTTFTDNVIKIVSEKRENVVFILWGKFAQDKKKIINSTKKKHHIIEAAHPSPLSVTKFKGCKVFSKTNEFLEKEGLGAIDWKLPLTI